MATGSNLQNAVINRHCGTLVTTGLPFNTIGMSFVLPRNSILTGPMDVATLQLRSEDAIPSIEQYVQGKVSCPLGTSSTLTFDRLSVFFYVAYGACILVFLEMVLDPQEPVTISGDVQNEEEKRNSDGDDMMDNVIVE